MTNSFSKFQLFKGSVSTTFFQLAVLVGFLKTFQKKCKHGSKKLSQSTASDDKSINQNFIQLFSKCLKQNIIPWAAFYGTTYAIFYIIFKDRLLKYKYDPKYIDKPNLIFKELFYNFTSMLIVTLMETFIISNKIPFIKHKIFKLDLIHNFGHWINNKSLSEKIIELLTIMLHFFLILCWADTHFYWYHRMCHKSNWLFKNIHSLHHESLNPNPISGISFHPIESLLYYSALFMVYFVPTPNILFQMYKYGLLIVPCFGHLSFGNTYRSDDMSNLVVHYFTGPFKHWLHHQKFVYNYGNYAVIDWDKIAGTDYKTYMQKYFREQQIRWG